MNLLEKLDKHLQTIKESRNVIDIICDELKENITQYFKNKIEIFDWKELVKLAHPSNIVIGIESSIESPTTIDLYIYDNYVKGGLSIEASSSNSELHDIRKDVYIKFNSPRELKDRVVKEVSNWIINNWKKILPYTSKLVKMTNDNRMNTNDVLKIEQAKKGKNFIKINPYEIANAIKYSTSITASRILIEPFISGMSLLDYPKYLEKMSTPSNILIILKEYIKDCIRFVKEQIDEYPLEYGQLNKNNVYDYYNYILKEQDSPGDGPAYDLLEGTVEMILSQFSNLSSNEIDNIEKIIKRSIFVDKLKRSWDQETLKKKLFREVYK